MIAACRTLGPKESALPRVNLGRLPRIRFLSLLSAMTTLDCRDRVSLAVGTLVIAAALTVAIALLVVHLASVIFGGAVAVFGNHDPLWTTPRRPAARRVITPFGVDEVERTCPQQWRSRPEGHHDRMNHPRASRHPRARLGRALPCRWTERRIACLLDERWAP